jgi:hypothetical protein
MWLVKMRAYLDIVSMGVSKGLCTTKGAKNLRLKMPPPLVAFLVVSHEKYLRRQSKNTKTRKGWLKGGNFLVSILCHLDTQVARSVGIKQPC